MTGFIKDQDRNVIPRWRTFDETQKQGELDSSLASNASKMESIDFLAHKKADWEKHKTVGYAADLVGAALTLERSNEVLEAVEFLLRDEVKASSWAKELAERSLPAYNHNKDSDSTPVSTKEYSKRQVRRLRSSLRVEPKDPISWVDLSHAYASLGLVNKATQSMTTALQLATDNRFVLRSASRLWIHLDEKDRAYDILSKSDRTRHDPWLMAAEIAVGKTMGKRSNLIKRGQNLLTGGKFLQSHISELASALATVEWSYGAIKKCKRLFKQSLEDPTENSIAQVAWVASRDNSITYNNSYLSRPNVYEARSIAYFLEGQWKQAVEQCKCWQRDQPFSSRPGILGSFIATVILEDFKEAKDVAQAGLTANPKDFLLLNNATVALINLCEFDEAKRMFSQIVLSEDGDIQDKVVRMATDGLLQFRTGNVERGRQLYFDARSLAESRIGKDSRLSALATAFHALEEFSHKGPSYHKMIDDALQSLKRQNDKTCEVLAGKLTRLKNS